MWREGEESLRWWMFRWFNDECLQVLDWGWRHRGRGFISLYWKTRWMQIQTWKCGCQSREFYHNSHQWESDCCIFSPSRPPCRYPYPIILLLLFPLHLMLIWVHTTFLSWLLSQAFWGVIYIASDILFQLLCCIACHCYMLFCIYEMQCNNIVWDVIP